MYREVQPHLTFAMIATPVDMRVIKQTPRTPVRTSVDIPVRTSVDTPVRTSVDTPVFGPLPTTVRRPHDAHQTGGESDGSRSPSFAR